MAFFLLLKALRGEVDRLGQSLKQRKLTERAQGILMRRLHMDEAAAWNRLTQLSRDRSLSLAESAPTILAADEIFQELERAAIPCYREPRRIPRNKSEPLAALRPRRRPNHAARDREMAPKGHSLPQGG